MSYTIRKGVKEDLPQVLELIKELAEYERALDEVDNTLERMEEDGFGDNPIYGFYVAEQGETIVGIALYYFRYSTWKGKSLYLEDIVVTELHRGHGLGGLLFDEMVFAARRYDCKQINWQVLDWNEPAINFYKRIGAGLDGEWINCYLRGKSLEGYKPFGESTK